MSLPEIVSTEMQPWDQNSFKGLCSREWFEYLTPPEESIISITSSLESILSTKTMIHGSPVLERSWKKAILVKVESADTEEQIVNDVDNKDEVVKEAKEIIASSRPNTTPPV